MIAYIVLIILALSVFGLVLKPVFEARRSVQTMRPNSLNDLRARRRYLMEALRDVDLDYATGKVEVSEYEETRHTYLREAAIVLREIEAHTGEMNAEIQREIDQLRDRVRESDDAHSRAVAQSHSEA